MRRAVDAAAKAAPALTLGPIIHNPQMVEALRRDGVVSAGSLEEIPDGARVVIRSHGVGRSELEALKDRGCELRDATCPFVARIHEMVRAASEAGIPVIVIGERAHPEVMGILGWTSPPGTTVMSEADVEVLRRALAEDIHKLSMVPDLSDESFAANASGVAMRFKLWGLEQLVNMKQRWFIEGLRQRLGLYARFLELRGYPALDVAGVKIALTRAMPANLLEQAQIAQMAASAGAASTETRVRFLHDADEWSEDAVREEAERIRCERQG